MNTPFLSVFRDLPLNGELSAAAEQIEIIGMEFEREKLHIRTTGAAKSFVDPAAISAIESVVKQAYHLQGFSLQVSQPALAPDADTLCMLCRALKSRHPMLNGFLDDAAFSLNEEKGVLTVSLQNGGREFIENARIGDELASMLAPLMGRRISVVFTGGERIPYDDAQDALAHMPPSVQSPASRNSAPEKPAAPARPAAPAQENRTYHRTPQRKLADGEELIFGKMNADELTPIVELDLNSINVTIRGDVFAVNHKELTSRNLIILSFDVTDYESSVRVTRAMAEEKARPIMEAINVGDCLLIQGQTVYNNFEEEITFNPRAIVRTVREKRKDNAPEKRVELHLHTNMSAMDAVTSAGDLVKQALAWGHKAIAITDHGVAQAFPDAAKAAKGKDIKVLYGMEAYYVSNEGEVEVSLDNDFVCFDLETTGLKAGKDGVTEIAAVKVKNGEIGETFHTLVNPGKAIPPKVTELTGITDEMVASAPPMEAVLQGFLDFIGDAVLVAHNAPFDMGFLRTACQKQNIPCPYCAVDTVELSRRLLPGLPKYNLKAVAEAVSAGDFRHHRAEDDTGVLAEITVRLFEMLREQGFSVVRALGPAREDPHSKKTDYYHMILIAKDYKGLRNLYELIGKSNLDYFKRKPRIPRDELERHREGLIIGSACEQGELFQAILHGRAWGKLCEMAEFYDFLEIQPLGNNMFMTRDEKLWQELGKESITVEDLKEYNRTVIRLGKAVNRPVVATCDVHFKDPRDEAFRRILMGVQGFSDADNQAPLYFRTTDEMMAEFDYLDPKTVHEIVIENPNKIADMCEKIQPVPDGTYPPSLPGSADELRSLVMTRAHELYGDPLPPRVDERIQAELHPIINNGFDVMYMIAQKLVKKSVDAGYLVGSRGSVGSSVVAYFAGITEVNSMPKHYLCPYCKNCEFVDDETWAFGVDMPDRTCQMCGMPMRKEGFDIPFATFLGFEGEKEPDIDLNFSGEYQAQAHRNTIEMFGEGHVFRAGTIGTVAEKTAFGYVKKYMEERNKTVSKAEMNRLALGCTGVRRTSGQHPGGLIVVPKDRSIYDFCPVQHPADDPGTDIITTHFDFHSIHDNLLKLDELGHDDPSIIRMLEDISGLNARKIPLDDPETMSLFTSSHALGYDNDPITGPTGAVALPEYGTKFVREMLFETKPKTFAGLVRISGLSHGTDVWLGNAQKLISEGITDLNGVICCRDDVTLYFISKGVDKKLAFLTSEGVRKGKGIKPETEEILREHNVPDWYIDSAKTCKYLFPRAHAVAYVMMAFRIAWFKTHRPLDFYATYFTIRATAFDPVTAVAGKQAVTDKYNELWKRSQSNAPMTAVEKDAMGTLEVCYEVYLRGLKFLPVDLYKSDLDHFTIEGNGLRLPFSSLGGSIATAAQDILAERGKRPFSSEEDLKLRCPKVTKSIISVLEEAGALAALPKSEQMTLFDDLDL